MLIYDPAKRIHGKEILKHSYFADLDKSTLPAGDYDGTLLFPEV